MPLIVAGIGSLVGGYMASQATSQAAGTAAHEQELAAQRAQQAWNNVQIPSVNQLTYQLQPIAQDAIWTNPPQLNPSTGQITAPNAYAGVSTSPEVQAAQQATLANLGTYAQQGFTAQEKAQIAQQLADIHQQEAGRQQAIAQQAQMRGEGGSGMQLAAQLGSQQGAANTASQIGANIASQSAVNKIAALQAQGAYATQLGGQQLQQQEAAAGAQNAINQFNAQQSAKTAAANLASQYQAGAERQNLAAQNTAIANQQAAQQAQARQTIEQMQAQRAGALSGIQENLGSQLSAGTIAQGQQQANIAGGTISALGNIYSGYAAQQPTAQPTSYSGFSYQPYSPTETPSAAVSAPGSTFTSSGSLVSDVRAKKNIKKITPKDIHDFLSKISGYKYDYTDPEYGTGKHMGVMAQDLEKTPYGRNMVSETGGIKQVDSAKLTGALAGAIAEMNKRLAKLEGKKK